MLRIICYRVKKGIGHFPSALTFRHPAAPFLRLLSGAGRMPCTAAGVILKITAAFPISHKRTIFLFRQIQHTSMPFFVLPRSYSCSSGIRKHPLPKSSLNKGRYPFSFRKSIHHQTPFLPVIKRKRSRAFHSDQFIQHRRLYLSKALLIQTFALLQPDVLNRFIFGKTGNNTLPPSGSWYQ